MTLTHLASTALDLETRAVSPVRELGAYEALWARRDTSFKTLAEIFRQYPDSVPSDFVEPRVCEKYSRMALGAIREAAIKHFGVRVHGAGEYPLSLRAADHPIELLYFQGDWDLASTPCVAIVGTRNPSTTGIEQAATLSRQFAEAQFTVVSGLAQGIDTVAHQGAIEAGGRTIAVLGTPITRNYPSANAELQRQIADKHLVISQVPIVRYSEQTYRGNRFFFPERNITMSALTLATVIVEAGNTSGTLIQARHAIRQKRPLFILESCFHNPELTWPERLVKEGAIRASTFEEIREHLAAAAPQPDRRADASGS